MSEQPTTIFLVNPISGRGHLDLYARLYSVCALELGFSVVLIAENGAGVERWVREHCPVHSDRFIVLTRGLLWDRGNRVSWDSSAPPPLPTRIRRIWRSEGARGLLSRVEARAKGLLIPGFEFALSRFGWGRQLLDFAAAQRYRTSFRDLVHEIRAAQERLRTVPALVVFLYLDLMAEDRNSRRYLERMGLPWSGILFHPRHDPLEARSRPERYFETSNARGAAFLNPHLLATYRRAFPHLIFGSVPDVTDASLPVHDPVLVDTIRRRANGRTIVVLLGSLSPEKGLMTFLQIIDRTTASDFFFAIVGDIIWATLGPDESAIRELVTAPPENCLVHVGYLEDERDLNAVINAADVIFAVYPAMRDSSNTLTKAAMLEKPVVVSEQYLMGERVKAYRIGATTPPDDVDQIIEALRGLRNRPTSEFGFSDYRSAHSLETLRAELGALMRGWLAAESVA